MPAWPVDTVGPVQRRTFVDGRWGWPSVAASWFSTLKAELVYRYSWPTRARARHAIFEFRELLSTGNAPLLLGDNEPGRGRGSLKVHHHAAP
jgi:hypothetical protein